MLLKTETIWMVVGIAGSVYFVITIVLFIYCKIRNITCCHKTHQESSTEFITDNTSRYPKFDREEGIRESAVCGDQDPTLQRYVKNPTKENNSRAKESDEQGEPKYDYATTGELSRGTGKTSKRSQKESFDHKKENTSQNETKTTKKDDESAVIEDTEVQGKDKATVHYENEIVDTSLKKAIDDTKNESVSDTSYVKMRNTDLGQYENEGAKMSSNQRHGNESNVYESVHGVSYKMMAVEIDIEENSGNCIAISAEGISDNMSHKKLNTDREHGSEQSNENLPTNSNYTETRGNEHGERLGNMDSYSKRESQGSGQSNESRKSDESEESNDSNKSRSTDISVRSDNTDTSVRSDNSPRESRSPTNSGQDSNAMYVNFYAQNIQIGPSTIYHLHTD